MISSQGKVALFSFLFLPPAPSSDVTPRSPAVVPSPPTTPASLLRASLDIASLLLALCWDATQRPPMRPTERH